MQGAGTARLKLALRIALPILVLAICILIDQLTKNYFKSEFAYGEDKFIIDNFFYFTYTVNTGAAWSFLAGRAWAQTFFKVLTGIALVAFACFMYYSLRKNLKWLSYSLALIIGGTIGNFIDRLLYNGVTDFIGVLFLGEPFPIFNLADSFLVVGLIMLIVYYVFLDNNALFRKTKKGNVENSTEQSSEEEKVGDGNQEISDK